MILIFTIVKQKKLFYSNNYYIVFKLFFCVCHFLLNKQVKPYRKNGGDTEHLNGLSYFCVFRKAQCSGKVMEK